MVTQYIGARYVPLFYTASDNSNDWESGVKYDPLTIVTYLNQSYTSKIPVPASVGNPADNPDYWVLTGGYNAQVAALQSDYDVIRADVDNLMASKYIFISDSYGQAAYGNWPVYLASYLGLSASDYTALVSSGGSLYSGNLLTNLTSHTSGLTDAEKAEVGTIVYLGGINDAHNDAAPSDFAAVKSGLADLCNYVKAQYPNATFYIGYDGNSRSDSAILNGRSWEHIAAALNIYSSCGQYGAVFIPNMEFVLHDYSLMNSDGIHPTAAGGQQIAYYAASAIKGGACDVKRMAYYNSDTAIEALWDTSANMETGMTLDIIAPQFPNYMMYIHQDNDIETIQFKARINLKFATTKTLTGGASLTCGKIMFPLWQPKPAVTFPLEGRAKLSDSSYVRIRAHMAINASAVYLRFDSYGDNWTNPTSLNVDEIIFDPAVWTLPTLMC